MVFMSRGGAGGSGGNIASGTYVGTGAAGQENPTVIHVPFVPRLLLIYTTKEETYSICYPIYVIPECLVAIRQSPGNNIMKKEIVDIEISGTDIKLYDEGGNGYLQANLEGTEYFWIAFG